MCSIKLAVIKLQICSYPLGLGYFTHSHTLPDDEYVYLFALHKLYFYDFQGVSNLRGKSKQFAQTRRANRESQRIQQSANYAVPPTAFPCENGMKCNKNFHEKGYIIAYICNNNS